MVVFFLVKLVLSLEDSLEMTESFGRGVASVIGVAVCATLEETSMAALQKSEQCELLA